VLRIFVAKYYTLVMILIREVWKCEERKEGERTSQRICIHNPISPPRPPHKKNKK